MADQARELEALERILIDESAEPAKLSYAVLELITKDFSEEIGCSGSGVVYLGVLPSGRVAVKQLWGQDISVKNFADEVNCLMRAKHKNIVRLLGYCADTQGQMMPLDGRYVLVDVRRRLLCFEYVPNGNVQRYLQEKPHEDEWYIRYRMIKGICQGLHYLHEERIILLALNLENVFLDSHMEPKITDFGLSRCLDEEQSKIFTSISGSQGYIAPELIHNGEISFKSDIFSLGNIIIKLLTGRNKVDIENWHKSLDVDCPQMKRCIDIAQICVDADQHNRPTIGDVIHKLNEMETVIQKESPVIYQKYFSAGRRGSVDNMEPSNMAHVVLTEMTDGFREDLILGRGSFGVVYKGEDKNGQELAVKVFHPMEGLDDKVFRRELKNLAKLKHQNIVQLVGFCNDEEEVVANYDGKLVHAVRMHRALCFEYVHNGSLRKHLSDVRQGLGWRTRYKIIKGICEGLKYLHTGLEVPVYHFDLKPDNILLDENMVPKIADFGLSRIFGEEKTKQTISSLGTLGYMPPEFVKFQIISKKFDIFSLGVIIIKTMIGPMGYSHTDEMEPAEFVEHVHNIWRETLQLIPGYTSIEIDCQQVKTCIEVALKCLEEKRHKRPSIEDIVRELSETEKNTNDPGSQIGQFHDVESILPKSDISDRPSADMDPGRTSQLLSSLPKELPSQFLRDITDGFSDERKVGEDAFGVVYKGRLQDGEEIAVKRLGEKSALHYKRFQHEVRSLMEVNHENVVKLIGYCYEIQKKVVEHNGKYILTDAVEKLLCYEYVPKGSLDKHLFDEPCELDWHMRFKIIKGICEGLRFLHEGLQYPIIHLDLKPGNILLDGNMVPKIADFGISRLLGQEQTRTYTQNVMGTRGYMAPEYLYRGEISAHSDIYSLGLLIMEIATGDKNCPNRQDITSKNFIENVRQNWTNMSHISSKYPSLDKDCLYQVKRCIEVGLNCVETNWKERPSIREIFNRIR